MGVGHWIDKANPVPDLNMCVYIKKRAISTCTQFGYQLGWRTAHWFYVDVQKFAWSLLLMISNGDNAMLTAANSFMTMIQTEVCTDYFLFFFQFRRHSNS